MKEYIVNITENALDDMEKIYRYIANELMAPDNARNQYNRITDAIFSLSFFPEKHALLDLELGLAKSIRKMVVDNYLVFYVVDSGTVTVLAVLFNASNISARLKKRQ